MLYNINIILKLRLLISNRERGTMFTVAAVVILYNPSIEDIKNMNSYIYNVSKVYVVDNSGIKSDLSCLECKDKIEYIFNGENFGIAKALNIACRLAIQDGYTYLLTMDQDSSFGSDFPQYLNEVENVVCDDIAIYSPWHKTNLKQQKIKDNLDYPLDVMMSGNIINLKHARSINFFDERLFIDGVDRDFCLRLKIAGYRIARLNSVEMEHSLGNIKYKRILGRNILITNHNYIRRYYIARNYLYIKKKYCHLDPTVIKDARMLNWAIKIIFFEKKKYKKIKSILLGKIDYHRQRMGVRDFKD